jgi:site-specific recombinase XerD
MPGRKRQREKVPDGPWNRGRKLPPEPLTEEEVRALIRATSNRAPTGIRNRALLVLLYRGGLRAGEALALLPKDLDERQGTVRVLHGKGDKARLVGLDEGAWGILQRWLDRRSDLGISRRRRVFCTLKGQPLQGRYVRSMIQRLARKAGIEKRVHAHGLRHTHAFELANEATPLHVIQQQLGHSSLATTDRYIRHLAPREVVEAMQGRKWEL